MLSEGNLLLSIHIMVGFFLFFLTYLLTLKQIHVFKDIPLVYVSMSQQKLN